MWVLKKLQRKKSRRRRFELVLIVSGMFPQSSPAGDAITPQVLRRDGCLSRATRDELLGLALTCLTGQFDASHPTGFGAPEEQHLIQGALHSHGTTAIFRRSCSTSPEGTHWHIGTTHTRALSGTAAVYHWPPPVKTFWTGKQLTAHTTNPVRFRSSLRSRIQIHGHVEMRLRHP